MIRHRRLHLCPPVQRCTTERLPARSSSVYLFSSFTFFLYSSSGIVYLTPDAWQLSEEDNTLTTMQWRRDRQRTRHLIYLKHLLSGVNDSTKGQHQRGGGWGPTLWGHWEVDLDIWPPIHATSSGPAAQIDLRFFFFFPLKTPHPSAEFLLMQASPRLPEAFLFMDVCSMTPIPPMTPIHI